MNYAKFFLPQLKLALTLPLVALSITSYSPEVQAQLTSSADNNRTRIYSNQPDLPENDAPTGRRRGGTSRGPEGCPDKLTALVPGEETVEQPQGKITSKSFFASTVAEYPTFWAYIPELPSTPRSAEFVLQVGPEGDETDVYRTQLTLPDKPGIIGISLPPNPQYALEIGKQYHWYFRVFCGNPQDKTVYYVDAFLKRVALPSLGTQPGAKPDYSAYAKKEFWYDALTHLAELRRTNSQNATLDKEWANLLSTLGLQDIAQAPIVQRYSLEK